MKFSIWSDFHCLHDLLAQNDFVQPTAFRRPISACRRRWSIRIRSGASSAPASALKMSFKGDVHLTYESDGFVYAFDVPQLGTRPFPRYREKNQQTP
ncbi:hypothetical protein Nham_4552 (plasmid) [Nitrobacter hamburgensis X14]|uniref:Uncharacterized protein n=1 Tax=Nitrobacter hamburgensis (strain DSM 10229 / NCIMB 13809 / X14) TaxID=323097 RepID=Q1QF70_NITHX|nr:hypothetical protein Nham_4552 [Nitrobacter hamburgensis X14]